MCEKPSAKSNKASISFELFAFHGGFELNMKEKTHLDRTYPLANPQ